MELDKKAKPNKTEP